MTADPTEARRAGRGVRTHLFLLAGQRPGQTHAAALTNAHHYGRAAELTGFDGVWIAEHHFITYGVCPSAVTFAAHLLGATRSIEVGTAACILSNRHPVALGEEAAVLHELSGGRFRLGVGRGGPWVDLEVFGTGLDRFHEGFAESLELLTRWLSGQPTVGGNSRFPFRPVPVVPRPTGRLPVWVAATSAGTVDLAARHGLPLLLGLHADLPEKAELLDRYARTAVSHGHDLTGIDHASAHLAQVAETDEAAAQAVGAGLLPLLAGVGEYVRLDGAPAGQRDPADYVRHLIDIHPVGSPRRCRQAVARAAALPGVRHLLFMVEAVGGREPTLDNIERLATTVLDLAPRRAPPASAMRRTSSPSVVRTAGPRSG
ncbi:Flavin-dependent oxidoreductase, luciferase family (includes alkanesulfonate monooxygenase SsuD and methylene tetrahydromethanopterin reductase) [Micromonospora phaseoli]|uniref:bacterial luciferase n=1 Tax=Micromonospora phaseoli TaxID=1144548 RepID=A0A1H6USI8_9ACTN|nr:LLM class flavin-dependent oxidoreductase [Micromonospora phaseoli]PZV99134.1 alkanesulfonate monooxygenase SsuD/methylene tetrahydromethanopterin reductase-like flavin-dependent oxidoreductase (luciferase family) [Micromonospora phaseoli]GIJ78664.1 alkanal monooxygenase [Micromonospora phaseoli]SEI95208.1 Flavin-dependent oxidoreductase, luciferase family (includes alkanesulfonate monooxygenase SsuD and methylene tetrahydromethanopterin reductase) [Micromonospora phaseoli]